MQEWWDRLSSTERVGLVCVLCIVTVASLAYVFSSAAGTVSPSAVTTYTTAPDVPDNIDVWVMVQDFVSSRLLTPGAAKFPHSSEVGIIDRGNGLYEVAGWVDTQNVYGALLRKHFVCQLQYQGNKQWTLVGLGFTG